MKAVHKMVIAGLGISGVLACCTGALSKPYQGENFKHLSQHENDVLRADPDLHRVLQQLQSQYAMLDKVLVNKMLERCVEVMSKPATERDVRDIDNTIIIINRLIRRLRERVKETSSNNQDAMEQFKLVADELLAACRTYSENGHMRAS